MATVVVVPTTRQNREGMKKIINDLIIKFRAQTPMDKLFTAAAVVWAVTGIIILVVANTR